MSRHSTLTIVLLSTTLLISRGTEHGRPGELSRPLEAIERQLGSWTATSDERLTEEVLDVLRPTQYISRTYQKGANHVGLFVAYYAEQRAGESMHSPKNCLPGNGWEVWQYGTTEVPVHNGRQTVNRYSVYNGSQRMLVLYWYQSRDRIIASEYAGKFWLVWDAIVGGRTAGSIVRITLLDQPGALEEGLDFASSLIPEVQLSLGR